MYKNQSIRAVFNDTVSKQEQFFNNKSRRLGSENLDAKTTS